MRSLPPLLVNSVSASIKSRKPLHFINETSISILLHEKISFFNSLNICGSCTAPVKSELCAIEVTGLIGLTLSLIACIVLVLFVTESNCLSSAISKSSATPSHVFSLIAPIILLTSSICFARLSSFSLILFKLCSTTFLTYLDKIPAASSLSICSFSTLILSSNSANSLLSFLLISSSYNPISIINLINILLN